MLQLNCITEAGSRQSYPSCKDFYGFPGCSVVKNPPASAGDAGSIPAWGRSPEEEMATHSSILAWEFPWTEEPGGLQSMGSWRVGQDLGTKTTTKNLNVLRYADVTSYSVWWITLLDFQILNYICMPWINITLVLMYSFLICSWILFINILWRIFFH